jgi:hypothetical protein
MQLHVLYRAYAGENNKDRPAFYDKRSSLASLVRSVGEADDVDLVFLNNGPIPAEWSELMEASTGRTATIEAPSMRTSYRAALRWAMDSDWPDDDVVYLVEDDYLHRPEALRLLESAARALPEVSYFCTYGSTKTHPVRSAELHLAAYPANWRPGITAEVDGQQWQPGLSATSTYAVRLGALRRDYSIILQSHLPYRNRYLDHDSGLVWQGYEPYRWADIARDALLRAEGGVKAKVRAAGEAPFKVAFNLRSHRRADNRRLLYVATPNLATHMESIRLAPGTDWAAIAADTDAWLARWEASGRPAELPAPVR